MIISYYQRGINLVVHALDFTRQTGSFINSVLLHITEKVKTNQPTNKIKQRLEPVGAHFRLITARLDPGAAAATVSSGPMLLSSPMLSAYVFPRSLRSPRHTPKLRCHM